MRYAVVLAILAAGCATNYTRYDEAHWWPSGQPQSVVRYRAAQLTTAGSKLAEGANTFTRLDDGTFESGNKSSGLDAAGNPAEIIKAAIPLLAALEPLLAPAVAQGPVTTEPSALERLISVLRAARGDK